MKTLKLLIALCLLPAAASAADTLDITQAVSLALQNNLYMKLARSTTEAGKAAALASASSLLPQVAFSISQTRTFNENATALGFGEAPGGGAYMTGPFSTFDARLSLVQSLLNLPAAQLARSKADEELAASLQEKLAAQQVAAAAALAYLDVLRSSAAVSSAVSGRDLAASLRRLAEDKLAAGTATGLDVLRARTSEAEETLRVSRARTELEDASLRLRHLLGLPLSGNLELTEKLAYVPSELPSREGAVRDAMSSRIEIRIARASYSAAEHALKGAKYGRLPSLDLSGSAAFSGSTPDSFDRLVGDLGVGLRVPLFEGGRVSAGVDASRAAESRAQSLLNDASVQVQEDTLSALRRLEASADEVNTASMTVTMAGQELEMARNRFAAGAGDNIELVAAQTSLSTARDSLVDALSRAKEANIRLTLALGRMQQLKF